MVKEEKYGQMEQFMKEIFLMIRNMETEHFLGMMGLNIKDRCSKIYFTVMEVINGQMVVVMRDNFKTIRCMEKDYLNGLMANFIRVIMKMT